MNPTEQNGTGRRVRRPSRRVIPGFGLTLGFTLTYLSLIILIPLAACFIRSAQLSLEEWRALLSDRQVLAALRLSIGASLAAAACNAVFGTVVAWVLVRYTLPAKRLIDAIVDMPFALPTAVAGIALTAIYSPTGWIGQWLLPIKVAYTPLGVFVAMVFIGLPFVVRTLQPVIGELDRGMEEASASLGATRWTTLRRVIFPALLPALMTGFTMAFARAVGEYGSIIFISGNLPLKTEILPLLIVNKLEQYHYAGATALAVIMLVISLTVLLIINTLQGRLIRR
jgi:sulfate/thiosulfate transport system permease protein